MPAIEDEQISLAFSRMLSDGTGARLRTLAALLVSLLLVVLTACSPVPPLYSEPSPSPSIQGNVRDYEYFTALAACMQDRGWNAEVRYSSGWSMGLEYPTAQKDLVNQAEEECSREVGTGIFEPNVKNAEYNYDNNVRVLDCLHEHGYPTTEPPTKAHYVNQVLEDRLSIAWDPYDEVPVDERRAAVMTCPQ